jgi:hypothetical protein
MTNGGTAMETAKGSGLPQKHFVFFRNDGENDNGKDKAVNGLVFP